MMMSCLLMIGLKDVPHGTVMVIVSKHVWLPNFTVQADVKFILENTIEVTAKQITYELVGGRTIIEMDDISCSRDIPMSVLIDEFKEMGFAIRQDDRPDPEWITHETP